MAVGGGCLNWCGGRGDCRRGLGLKIYNLIHHTLLMLKEFLSKCKICLEDNHKIILSLGVIATVIIAIISVWTVHSSNKAVLETNERLVEKMPPIEPSLIIAPKQSKEDLVFLASYLADIRPTQTGELVRSDVELRFTVKNIGQTETGSVQLNLFGNWIHPRNEMLILGGLDSDRVEFRIWYNKCSLDNPPPSGCVAENVPTGPQNLTLEAKCEMCRNTTLNREFEICIEYDGTECDDWLNN
jgi:hypothetical protein